MSDNTNKKIAINGAGPVGALLAVMLAKKGYQVDLFESRPDSRKTSIYQGKSINLALSDRGWKALNAVGLDEEIRQQAIPMYCRVMHDIHGNITKQPYGKEDQAIWSVSRAGINEQLINLAEKESTVDLHFGHRLTQLNFSDNTAVYIDDNHHQKIHESDLVFGADGVFSKVRRLMQELPKERMSYSLNYMQQSYMELSIAANEDGSHKLEKNALHIWPRKNFMLIALPNLDGSFTCTLFMDHDGELSFSSLSKHENNHENVSAFFQQYFNDAMKYLDDPVEDFLSKAPSPLCLVHIYPWLVNDSVALIGDAAHAMVPFYGQGMNCGFEDCRILAELVEKHEHQWSDILNAYQQERKENGDAITELAKRNFIEMSDLAGDERFLLRKKIEAKFHKMHPELWIPLYSMVTFSPDIPYKTALSVGDIQTKIMDEIMHIPNIEQVWQQAHVYQKLLLLAQEKLVNHYSESKL
jgi:kynurenine 3-monooxygenase